MLSALLVTNAMPRSIHMVPSVMMNGCTPSPITMQRRWRRPQRPTPTQTESDKQHRRRAAESRVRAQHQPHRDAGQRVDRAHREIDPAGDDDDRRPDRHDREEARVGRHLDERVEFKKLLTVRPVASPRESPRPQRGRRP